MHIQHNLGLITNLMAGKLMSNPLVNIFTGLARPKDVKYSVKSHRAEGDLWQGGRGGQGDWRHIINLFHYKYAL